MIGNASGNTVAPFNRLAPGHNLDDFGHCPPSSLTSSAVPGSGAGVGHFDALYSQIVAFLMNLC
jgi:hypothetical protein